MTDAAIARRLAPIPTDAAQVALVEHLARTEVALRNYIRTLDTKADCTITAAADLGPPYDALRLWGGFATGCLVNWDCRTPVVPVDVTMNVDTTSVFYLDRDPGSLLSEQAVSLARGVIDNESSYIWNFDSGNHFISLARTDSTWMLVLHSNEKEFKDQYNGLFPREKNWYADRIRVADGPRPIRVLVGDDAVTYAEMAEMLVPFNRLRHRLIARLIVGGAANIVDEWHKEHYFMPTRTSAAIGSYLGRPSEPVLVFSSVGRPLMWFEPHEGGSNQVSVTGEGTELVIPHGWGMTADRFSLHIARDALTLNDRKLEFKLGTSLFEGLGVRARMFRDNSAFVDAIAWHTPGRIIEELTQVESYSRHGSLRHQDQ